MSQEGIEARIGIDLCCMILSYLETRESALDFSLFRHLDNMGLSSKIILARGENQSSEDLIRFCLDFCILIKFLMPLMEQLETGIDEELQIDWDELWGDAS